MCSPRWRATDAGLRWTAVTIDDADDAKNALDRITIPQDVLDRIGPTALPRSSIVVSDEPLSAETNYRTEFVAVLSNQPQGGFITREPSTDTLRCERRLPERRRLRVLFSAQLEPPNWQCPSAVRLGLSLNATGPAVRRGKPRVGRMVTQGHSRPIPRGAGPTRCPFCSQKEPCHASQRNAR